MKALLLYPEYPDTFWSFRYAIKFVNKKALIPPLGLLTIATMLPDKWEKKLIDLNVSKLKDADIKWADIVFVSAMIVQKQFTENVFERGKAFDKYIVAGGPLFKKGDEYKNVNTYILGEAESLIPLFINDYKEGKIKSIYSTEERPDITKTPIPQWELINSKYYSSLALQISRGCPFNCDFCDIIITNGRVPRVKTPQQVIAELEAIYNYGYRGSVFVVDDNFIGNKIKVKNILREIIEWMELKKYPFSLYTEASINLADDPELMELMRKANFASVFVGIESPDEESLLNCGKIQNTNKNMVEKVKILQRSGLQVMGGFIMGFDTDTHNTFDRMIKFIQSSGIVTSMVGLLNAFPETQLHKRLKDAGRLLKISSGNNCDYTINFIPNMDKDKLIEEYKRVLQTIFSPKNYYKRAITFLKEYHRSSKDSQYSLISKIKAFFLVILRIGIIGKGKRHFWKMMMWTVLKKPSNISEAFSISIYGFHFRKVLRISGRTN